ncbi:adenylate/guanylate cyclase domain-containing protein [Chryseobacterium gambrini]|uniref:Adenylate/guanylate cyclase domain-containing protein n=1 Tax=Chryseobacterium gambrini TaxID=373672 RepID=A0AAJ1R0X8_9FLAO|nr:MULTISPECIES: adenylate/guanylate cyclase domain-containing protein [Chryseobacterium]MDN4011428.1 adenylate/guanylate cyclase domain-containing protein [Chryseobacterium gambrini]QWA38195.1 adenylate/guanylate cyclase domain-containing protein [Chryseobacterium sp. ZHDP1]
MKLILDEIEKDIIDIRAKNFRYVSTSLVPSRHDTSLTFERGEDKVGKEIDSCVLYVDIRNSVELNRKHHTQTMGRIYTAFSKAMLKIAKHHGGYVRNIIGDRVMIVFPKDNCYTNAVNCAISIYHIAHDLINKVFEEVNFECGIGIDYGNLKIVKVGLHRRGSEGFDNKNLVWVGYPANIASRLTDVANKSVEKRKFKVEYYPYNFFGYLGFLRPFSPLRQVPTSTDKLYSDTPKVDILTGEEFTKNISFSDVSGISYSGGKLIRFDKSESKIDFPPILMTSRVYSGFKAANPTRDDVSGKFWKKIDNHNIKNVDVDVYGGTVNWVI